MGTLKKLVFQMAKYETSFSNFQVFSESKIVEYSIKENLISPENIEV